MNPVDEREILIALRDAARDRAVVVVAHRISTVAWTDRIIVMAHGKILEDGAFRDLLQSASSLVHAMHALEGPGHAGCRVADAMLSPQKRKLLRAWQLDARERRYIVTAAARLASARLELSRRATRDILADLQSRATHGRSPSGSIDVPTMAGRSGQRPIPCPGAPTA